MRIDSRILAPVFLMVQGGLVYQTANSERMPPAPDLSRFPAAISNWRAVAEDKIAGDVAAQLGADQSLSRIYSDQAGGLVSGGRQAGLFVAWFQSQRGGVRQPHSPKVCLPGAGWTPEESGDMVLTTPSGPINVNRMVVSNRGQRAVVLYWYQTPRRVVSGEWAAKFWLVADALRDRRSDTSLVRVIAWIGDDGNSAALNTASEFARTIYPVLKAELPR